MTVMPPIDAAILICCLLLMAYTLFVASECSRGARPVLPAFSVANARLGVAAALGTGLWATQAIAMLSRSPATVSVVLPLAALSWLGAVGAASVALQAATRWKSGSPRAVLPLLLVCALLLTLMHASGTAARGLLPGRHLDGVQLLATLAAALAVSAAIVFAITERTRAASRMPSVARLAIVLGLLAFAVAQSLLGGELQPFPSPPSDAESGVLQLSSGPAALLAAAAAVLVLTLTRFAARIEQHLHRKAEKLSTSLHEANQSLHKLAYNDPLTGLSNRLMFDKRLAKAVAAADAHNGRLTLIFIDLDGFKPVNDCYGHASGDRVLRAVGERLRGAAPKGTTIARIGGDEFVMLVRQTMNTGEASLLASRVLVALKAPYSLDDAEVPLSCSIGIAFYPDCGAADQIIAAGDAAMYVAKRSGGSTFAFHEPGMSGDIRSQAELARDLRKAIDHNQFELYYQPKINARSGQVTAVEALLRWNHPERGMVPPDLFIPLAERAGLIGRIGDWVLEQACRQMHEWQGRGVLMRVSVNLSAQQLRQAGLVGRIEHLLERYRIVPELLTCEVTESTAMSDTRVAHRTLTRLGRLGLKVSIDDFGTGYSSLSYLRQLPATELKIDRSFISDVDSSNDARAIVQAVIQLAHALELSVVAEGVETAAQRDMLHSLGCDEFQGYLFAKPLPAAMVLQWALAERPKPRTFRPSLFLKSLLAPLS